MLAVSSTETRARLRSLLADDPSIQVVAEADSGHAVTARAAELDVQTIICDAHVIGDPSMDAMFAPHVWKPPCQVVLVTTNTLATPYRGAIPVAATVSLDTNADELGPRLRGAVKRNQGMARAHSTPGAAGRFLVAPAQAMARPVDYDTRSAAGQPRSAQHAGLPRQEQRRHRDDAGRDLGSRLRSLQLDGGHRRDRVTGLPNVRALALALHAVPTVNHPAAVVVLDMWKPRHAAAVTEAGEWGETALMRSIGARLRVNVRQDDLVCHLKQMLFAVVLPGVGAANAPRPVNRLRGAIDLLRQTAPRQDEQLGMAVGIGFWKPGADARNPFEMGWQAMVAERRAAGYI
jgi:GGDEF domain-containing protein/DNA-binding NarL/FixJ family response regulator